MSSSPEKVSKTTVGFTTPLRNKKLDSIIGANEGEASPALKIPASPMLKLLGYGTGVGVFSIERSPNVSGQMRSPWAVKKISKIRAQNHSSQRFAERIEMEAEILRQLVHPNIIGYRAFSKSKDGSGVVALAMEQAPKSLGDLIVGRMEELEEQCLLSSIPDPNPFPANIIQKVILDMAKALEYLHYDQKLIHGDIKSANVLIFGDFEIAKLCDFGVSRKIKEDGTLDGVYEGTEIWTPMEVLLTKKSYPDKETKYPIGCKSDIYPLGLTVYEMIALYPPHLPNMDKTTDVTDDSESSFDESYYELALAESLGKRPPLPIIEFDDTYNLILALFYCCTEEDPSLRPDSADIVKLLATKDKDASLGLLL